MEHLEKRTLLDAASLDPHGMFPGEMFLVGDYADDMVLADFNGDGNPDVAATNRYNDHVAVLLGKGDGTLASATHDSVGAQAQCIATGDVNNDGYADLVTGNIASITVLLGQGNGSFEAQLMELPGTEILDVKIADVNEDGTSDILAADHAGGRLLVLPGRGDGTFGDRYELAAGEGARAVSLADLNGDGQVDIVTANALNNSVSVLLGEGQGDFQTETRYDVGRFPSALELADLNEDGWADLVVANYHDKNISVFFGTGDGSFAQEVRYATGNYPLRPLPHDFNGDGHLDLLVPNSLANDITLLLNQGDGSFAQGELLPTGYAPYEVIVEDMNSDGRDDLAVLCWGTDTVAIHLANEDGSFQFPAYHATQLEPQNVVLADFNRDGHLDAACVNPIPSTVDQPFTLSVHLGLGDGAFANEIRTELPENGDSPVVGDVNEDGDLDLVLTYGNALSRTILLGHGDGTFTASSQKLTEQCRRQTLEDVDFDGHLDLVCCSWDTRDGDVAVSVYRGHGDGTFSLASSLPISRELTNGQPLNSPAVQDVNADGYPDLVVLGASRLLVLFGKEGAAFQQPQIYEAPGVESGVEDFNEDGYPDCFVNTTDSLLIFLNQGDGTFADPLSSRDRGQILSSTATDLNRDGHADILSFISQAYIRIHLGHGDGTFAEPTEYADGSTVYAGVVGDLNEDGWGDLAFADLWTGDLCVSLQNPRAGAQSPGMTIGGATRLVTSEVGETASFKITLDNQPTADVTITLSSSDTTEGTLSTTSLTFTPENWSTSQVVTVFGVDDDLTDGPVAFSILVDPTSSADFVYAAMAERNLQVVNLDNELTLVDLGVIDFRKLEALDLSGGVLGYSFEATRSGILTAEAVAQVDDVLVELALFDAGRIETPLDRNSSSLGSARVEWTLKQGRSYILLASGAATAADIRLANLLQRDGSQVTVHGTNGDDFYSFSAAGQYEVVVNDLAYRFDPAEADSFLIDGGEGNDRLALFDSSGDDSLRRTSQFVSLTGPGYKAVGAGFETVVAHAHAGGLDVAQIDDSQGSDAFVGTPTWSEMTGQGYSIRVEAFEAVHAYQREQGGTDTATLQGGDGNEKLKSYPDITSLRATNGSYLVRTKFFENVSADAGAAGKDVAIFYDSTDDDTFRFDGASLTSRIVGGTRREYIASGFRRVEVRAGVGHDVAYLTDTSGDGIDVFYLKSHKSQLVAQDVNITVRSFDTVYADANQSGVDVARIYDTQGNDHLEVAGDIARLYRRNGNGLELLYETIAIERVKAYRTTGSDTQDIQEHMLELLLYGWDE